MAEELTPEMVSTASYRVPTTDHSVWGYPSSTWGSSQAEPSFWDRANSAFGDVERGFDRGARLIGRAASFAGRARAFSAEVKARLRNRRPPTSPVPMGALLIGGALLLVAVSKRGD